MKNEFKQGDLVRIECEGLFPENILMVHFYNGKTGKITSVEDYVCEVEIEKDEKVYFRHESLTLISKGDFK